MTSRTTSQLADRLRTALRFHVHRPEHRAPKSASGAAVAQQGREPNPGEEFARRLRAALDA